MVYYFINLTQWREYCTHSGLLKSYLECFILWFNNNQDSFKWHFVLSQDSDIKTPIIPHSPCPGACLPSPLFARNLGFCCDEDRMENGKKNARSNVVMSCLTLLETILRQQTDTAETIVSPVEQILWQWRKDRLGQTLQCLRQIHQRHLDPYMP